MGVAFKVRSLLENAKGSLELNLIVELELTFKSNNPLLFERTEEKIKKREETRLTNAGKGPLCLTRGD